ncbi:MAG TPA: bifunctional precorrin-2 dehydrogenase/sirohydrochlorin ferrochelatase [Candidatus Binataceae bacterium]|nr:bifunctional precorrin-2 dehydrogenase/sirohydrochlorin ferrochelatase [Candidatus Binataceae bacterium]
MGFIPIFLQVQGKPCLVVGGGEVALRRVLPLLDAGASITVITSEATAELASLAESGRIALMRRAYRRGDMQGYCLVYAATDDRALQRRLFEESRELNILINMADEPESCSFIVPSVIRRGQLQVAISTAGSSPATARLLRQRLERSLGDEFEALLEVMAGARRWLKSHEPDSKVRACKLNALAASGLGEALREGDAARVERIVALCLGDGVRVTDLGADSAISRNRM